MSLALLGGQAVPDKILKQKKYVLEPVTSFSLTIHDPLNQVPSFFPTLSLFGPSVRRYLDFNSITYKSVALALLREFS